MTGTPTIVDASLRRPVLAVMVNLAVAMFGALSLSRLPVRELPRMDFPVVTVSIVYPGASPEVVEESVTDLLEEQIHTIEGIRSLQSSSGDGGAQITVQFDLERDVDIAAQEVRDRISAVRQRLPPDLDEPVVAKLDLDAQAILWIAVTSTDRDRVEITEYAEDVLKPALETVRGVGGVIVGGAQAFAVRLWLDPQSLAARDLTTGDVARALRAQNAELPSGRVEGVLREFPVRTEGDLPDVESFGDLVLAFRGGAPVRLRDVGRVEGGPQDARATARFSRLPDAVGREAVGLGILKQTEANTVDVARRVRERLGDLARDLPDGMEATVAFDGAVHVEEAVRELRENLGAGALLAALVVLGFLASARAGVLTAVSIPVSILGAFAAIHFLGFTINTLTMLALVLAVGMVVDDAIVVVENIDRHRRLGKGALAAARDGAGEIAFSVVTATVSIAVVFLPLAFVEGMVGRMFLEFAVTVAAAILVSLVVALTLVPMLAGRFLSGGGEEGAFSRAVTRAMGALAAGYGRLLGRALRARAIVVAACAGTVVLTAWLGGRLGKELQPAVDEGSFILTLRAPQGATLAYTDRSLRQIEAILSRIPEVRTYFTAIGLGRGGVPKVHEGIAFVRLRPLVDRRADGQRGQSEVMADLRRLLGEVAGLQVLVMPRPSIASQGQGAPLQMVILGPEVEALYDAGEALRREAGRLPGLVDVTTNLDLHKPQVRVVPDRGRAADLGVDLDEIARTLRGMLSGEEVTEFRRGGRRHEVILQLDAAARASPAALGDLCVRARGGALVPLAAVAEVVEAVGPSEIHRYDRARSLTLSANLEGVPLGEALAGVESLAARTLPPGMRTVTTGQTQDMQESFASLKFTLLLSVAIIYMVLASEFNHFVHPLTVMLSLPLAAFGALGFLWILGLTLNLFSFIGLIMLMGIVTRNAILLVDHAIRLRAGGMSAFEAARAAGEVRLRPILMTAISTVFGILPALVGTGSGSETRRPLAAAVIGGMTLSTLLTLLVVPVVFTLLDDLAGRLRSGKERARGAGVAGGGG